MFKKLGFVLLCTLTLTAEDVVSNTARKTIEKYGLRVHVKQSSIQSEKICNLAKIDSPAFVGVEYSSGLLVLIEDNQSTCKQLMMLLEKENYIAEIIKLHRVNYTLPPNLMDEVKAGRLCIMPDRRMCIMLDQTTWSWRPISSN